LLAIIGSADDGDGFHVETIGVGRWSRKVSNRVGMVGPGFANMYRHTHGDSVVANGPVDFVYDECLSQYASLGKSPWLYTLSQLSGKLDSPMVVSNGFKFKFTGVQGSFYSVQVSTNLVDWTMISIKLAPYTFIDTTAGGFPQRFYRSV